MLRFLRKYNKIILVVGGCLLMIAFMAQGTVDQLIARPGEATVGTLDGDDVTRADVEIAATDMRLVQAVSPVFSLHSPGTALNLFDDPKPLEPIQWLLILADAKNMGLGASRSEAVELLKLTNIKQDEFSTVLRLTGASEDRVLDAIGNWSIVQQYIGLAVGHKYVSTPHRVAMISPPEVSMVRQQGPIAGLMFTYRTGSSPRVSEPMLKRFIYDQSAEAQITALEIKSDRYLNEIAPPKPEAMKALFEQFKDSLPGEGKPYGFGYRYPDRVKLEYMKVPFDRVLELVQKDTSKAAELEAEAYEYYELNKETYIIRPSLPTNLPIPGITPKPNDGKESPTKGDPKPTGKTDSKDSKSNGKTDGKASPTKDGKTSPAKDAKKPDDAKKSGNATDLILPTDTVEVLYQNKDSSDGKSDSKADAKTDTKKTDAKTATTKGDAKKGDAKKDDTKKVEIKKDDTKKSDAKTDGKTDGKTDEKTDGKTDGNTNTTRVPVIEFQPFRSVRKIIIAKLQREKAEKLVGKITKAAQTLLLSDARSLKQDVGYYVTDKEGWSNTSLSIVAEQIQKQFGILPDVVRYDGEWLDEDGVRGLKDFGVASVIGQRASTWQYVFSEKTFVEAGSNQSLLAGLRLQAKIVSQPVIDVDDSQYLFRVIAAESSKAPKYEDRLEELEGDARKLAAYEVMQKKIGEWNKRAETDKLEDIATKEGVIVQTPPPFRKRETDFSDNVGGLTVPTIGVFGKSPSLTDAIFNVADSAFTKGELKTLPASIRSGAATVDGRLSAVLFRVESYKPITKKDYESQVRRNAGGGLIQQGLTTKDAVDPLSEESLAKRVNFVRDESDEEEESTEDGDEKDASSGAE